MLQLCNSEYAICALHFYTFACCTLNFAIVYLYEVAICTFVYCKLPAACCPLPFAFWRVLGGGGFWGVVFWGGAGQSLEFSGLQVFKVYILWGLGFRALRV